MNIHPSSSDNLRLGRSLSKDTQTFLSPTNKAELLPPMQKKLTPVV